MGYTFLPCLLLISLMVAKTFEAKADVVTRRNLFTEYLTEDIPKNSSKNEDEVLEVEKLKEVIKSHEENSTKLTKNNTQEYIRLKLPSLDRMKVGREMNLSLPGDMEAKLKVLSASPVVFEIENFIDEEDCQLLIDLALSKNMKTSENRFSHVEFKNVEETFKEWDYNQDGFIEPEEITLLPGLTDVKFTVEDADDMFFVLKMDTNGDGKVDFDELKETNLGAAKAYFDGVKQELYRRRNISSKNTWIWHDKDELLKFTEDGYFDKYHDRIAMVTDFPVKMIEESEPLQVSLFGENQFQIIRQDSDPIVRDIPCCLYGDTKTQCRFCRYISFMIFLSDVEEGGELAFPLANHRFQDVMNNSGEWRGYFTYAKTTGNRFYYKAILNFTMDGANRIFTGEGKDESDSFYFQKSIILGETVKFEKAYNNNNKLVIKYHGKIVEGAKITGNWWVPGHKRLRGTFFMWNREYEIFSTRAVDEVNQPKGCPKSSLTIKPKKGTAVFWYNHHVDPKTGMVGELNREAMFAHCDVIKGEKWIASSWINIIGDGDLTLRAWRRGNNMLLQHRHALLSVLGAKEKPLVHEDYETAYLRETSAGNRTDPAYSFYEHKPASGALQALQILFNDMDNRQLAAIASTVHYKLGLTCVALDN